MLALSLLAGILIYLSVKDNVIDFFGFKEKSFLIPIFFIILLISGVVLASTFHYMEIINRNNSAEQNYSIHFCAIESQLSCQANANAATNESYQLYLAGKIQKVQVSIPISLIYQAQRNIGTAFFIGMIIGWAVGVLLSERKQ